MILGLVLFGAASSGAVEVWSTQVLGLATILGSLLLIIPRLVTATPFGPHRWILAALGGILLLGFIQIFTSVHPFHTRLGLVQMGAAIFAFAAGATLARRWIEVVVIAIVITGSLVASFGILQLLSQEGFPVYRFADPSGGRARGPFVNANHFAGYLELILPLALGLLFAPRGSRDTRPLLLVVVGILGAGIILSLSRMGVISLAASMVLFIHLLEGRRRWVIPPILVGGVLMIGLSALVGTVKVRTHGPDRLEAWRMTLEIIREHPLLGTGLRTFQDVSPMVQGEGVRGWYGESHNDFLNLVSDMGLVGAALVIAAGILWIGRVRGGMRSVDEASRPILAGCLASLFGLLLHEAVDFNLQIPSNSFLFALVAGFALSITDPRPFPRREVVRRRIPAAVLVTVILAAAAWSLCKTWSADIIARSGDLASLMVAERGDPLRWDIPYRRGRILEEEGDTEGARDAYSMAVGRNPLSGQARYKLGVQEERMGRRDLASSEFRQAVRVAPNNPDILFRVASYTLQWYFEGPEGARDPVLLRESLANFRRSAALDPDHLRRTLEKLAPLFRRPERLQGVRPETPWGHRLLGEIFLEKREWSLALEEFRAWERMAEEGEKPLALMAQGDALARAGRDAPALRLFREGSERARDPGAYLDRVFDRMRAAGRLDIALPLFREGSTPVLEGRALGALGRTEEARAVLGRVQDGEASFHLFLLEEELGNLSVAEDHAREAIRLDPSDALYHHHLARFLEGRGRIREALIEAEEALRLLPHEERYRVQVTRLESLIPPPAQD